jgi:hypothetical protein
MTAPAIKDIAEKKINFCKNTAPKSNFIALGILFLVQGIHFQFFNFV